MDQKKYLSIWSKDQEITWNELLERYDSRADIDWLYDKLVHEWYDYIDDEEYDDCD